MITWKIVDGSTLREHECALIDGKEVGAVWLSRYEDSVWQWSVNDTSIPWPRRGHRLSKQEAKTVVESKVNK